MVYLLLGYLSLASHLCTFGEAERTLGCDVTQGGRYRAVAHLPTSIIGWVIGHKGCNARMLKQQTGTELWVDVPGQVMLQLKMLQLKMLQVGERGDTGSWLHVDQEVVALRSVIGCPRKPIDSLEALTWGPRRRVGCLAGVPFLRRNGCLLLFARALFLGETGICPRQFPFPAVSRVRF